MVEVDDVVVVDVDVIVVVVAGTTDQLSDAPPIPASPTVALLKPKQV